MNSVRIGPYSLMGVILFAKNPLGLIGILLSGFSLCPLVFSVREWPQFLREALWYSSHFHIGLYGVGLLTIAAAMSYMCYATSSYSIDETGLVVKHGLFSPFSRRGFFTGDTNGIAFNLIVDADPGQSMIQMMTGAGNLHITTVTGEIIVLPFVHNPEGVRQVIMSRAGISKVRPFTRVGVNNPGQANS